MTLDGAKWLTCTTTTTVADPGISYRGGGGAHKIARGEIYEKRWSEATEQGVSGEGAERPSGVGSGRGGGGTTFSQSRKHWQF